MIWASGLVDTFMEETMPKTERNLRRMAVIGALIAVILAGLATVAIAQSGSSISLNAPVSFPVDI